MIVLFVISFTSIFNGVFPIRPSLLFSILKISNFFLDKKYSSTISFFFVFYLNCLAVKLPSHEITRLFRRFLLRIRSCCIWHLVFPPTSSSIFDINDRAYIFRILPKENIFITDMLIIIFSLIIHMKVIRIILH